MRFIKIVFAGMALAAGMLLTALGGSASASPVAAPAGSDASTATSAAAPVYETYRNLKTGRCLDDSRLGLRTAGCTAKDFQQWEVRNLGGSARTLKNKATHNCLDDSAHGLRAYPCDGLNYQTWYVIRFPGGQIAWKNAHTHNCLDDSPRYKLRAYPCTPSAPYQHWY